MDYEKKYKEALERAKKLRDNANGLVLQKWCENVFPELGESEDEKIRKKLIESVKGNMVVGGTKDKQLALAWLEKQGEQKHKIQPRFKIGDIIRFKGNETLKGETETHKIISYDNELYVFADGTTDLFCEQDLYEIVEQEPVDEAEPKFRIGDKVRFFRKGTTNEEPMTITKIDEKGYWSGDLFICSFNDADRRLKLVEQKSADKVEPKFHEDEWITNGDYTWKIVEVKPLDYILQSQDGNIVDNTISHVDEQFHSWTIQEATPGDVIYLPNGDEYYLFIFKGIENAAVMSFAHFYQYCNSTSEVKGAIDKLASVNDIFQPATKEQQDTFERAITNAGYRWDAEKKEFIEEKPAWIEEDERIRKALITFFQEFPYGSMEKAGTNAKEALTWLEKQGQHKESQHEKDNKAMPQYINKSDLITELERRRIKNARNKLNLAASLEDNYLLSFLDAIEVKEIDLEKLGEIARHLIAVKNNIENIRLDKEEWSMLEKIGYPERFKAQKGE